MAIKGKNVVERFERPPSAIGCGLISHVWFLSLNLTLFKHTLPNKFINFNISFLYLLSVFMCL